MWNGRNGLTAEQIAQYRSSLNQQDVIWNPQYDLQLYPAAGQGAFTFFGTPIGQGTTSAPGGAGAKTIQDTNMVQGSSFPAGNQFLAVGIEFDYFPANNPGFLGAGGAAVTGRNTNDLYTVGKAGIVTLTVQNRIYVQDGPLNKFPSQTNLVGLTALSDATTAGAGLFSQIEYASWGGLAYNIVPILIKETQAFSLAVAFAGLVPTISTQTGRIGARLLGKMIRNAQ